MVLAPTTTFESPVVAPKLLTFSVSMPLLEAVTVRAAAMPPRLPVFVGALELTLIVLTPPAPVTVVGLPIDWMLMVSLRLLPVIEIESAAGRLPPLTVLDPLPVKPRAAAAAVTLIVSPVSLKVYLLDDTDTVRASALLPPVKRSVFVTLLKSSVADGVTRSSRRSTTMPTLRGLAALGPRDRLSEN